MRSILIRRIIFSVNIYLFDILIQYLKTEKSMYGIKVEKRRILYKMLIFLL